MPSITEGSAMSHFTNTSIKHQHQMMNISSIKAQSSNHQRASSKHSRRPRPRRRVAFAEIATFYEVLSLQEYTDEELSNCWHTPEDNHQIQKDLKRTVKAMRKGHDETTRDGLCTRGLETLGDAKRLKQRIAEREILVDAVFKEQMRQEQYCYKRIAAISSLVSKQARHRAANIATLDASSVKQNFACPTVVTE